MHISFSTYLFNSARFFIYGVNIPSVCDNLLENVKYRVEEFTGLKVQKINIFVEGVRVID